MNKLRKIQLSIVAIVAAGLIIGAGTYMAVPTFAQENDNPTKETPINKFLSKVASILGIEEETLTSAMDQAKQEIHDEAKEELKAKNENLSRELAECVREVIEYQYAYRELNQKAGALKQVFVNFLVKNDYQTSHELANHYVDEMARREMSQKNDT